jgi:hypothetical protein
MRGWHVDPTDSSRRRYWDGQGWSGSSQATGRQGLVESRVASYRQSGLQRIWYGRIMRVPVVREPVLWLNYQVPVARGHLDFVMRPRVVRELERATKGH